MYVFQILDWYCATFSLVVISLLECVVVAWIYGKDHRHRACVWNFCHVIELSSSATLALVQIYIWRIQKQWPESVWCMLTGFDCVQVLTVSTTTYARWLATPHVDCGKAPGSMSHPLSFWWVVRPPKSSPPTSRYSGGSATALALNLNTSIQTFTDCEDTACNWLG